MRRLISILFKVCLAVLAFYYLGVNGFLMSPLAAKVMTIAPEITQIRYGQAYTLIPFRIVVEDLELSVQDPSIQMFISADHAEGTIYPWTLVGHRFFATDLKGDGVVFRLRERLDKEKATPATLALMPEIPGYESIEREATHVDIKPLAVELENLHVTNLLQVWVNEFRFDGHLNVNGGFFLEALKTLQVDETELTEIRGDLKRGKNTVAHIKEAKLAVKLDEISIEQIDSDQLLAAVNATVSMEARIHNAQFLNAYLRQVPQVHIEEGGGSLSAAMSIEKGVFFDDSTLSLDTSKVVVQLPYFDIVGRSAIRWRVKKGTSYFTVRVPEVLALNRKDGKRAFTGTNFDLAASTPADLSKMNYLNLDVAIEKGKAPDLSFLNDFIPEGTGLHIASGAGLLTGKLTFSTRSRHAKGTLDIEGNQLSVKNRSATLTGHAKIHGEIVDLNVDTGAMNISGSSIALNDVGIWADGDVHRGFAAKLIADPCVMSPQAKVKWSAKLTLNFSNLQPVLSMVSANAPIPGILKAFADVPNVRVSSELLVHAKEIEVRKLRVDSSKVQVDGDFKLLESGEVGATEAKLYPWGAVLVKVRALSAGVDMQGSMVRPILGDPEGWFAKYRAEHPTPSAETSAASL